MAALAGKAIYGGQTILFVVEVPGGGGVVVVVLLLVGTGGSP